MEDKPAKLKQFVLTKCHDLADHVKAIIKNAPPDSITASPLKYRRPWELLWGGNISKGKVCVAGDALHPMTPDLGQGVCSALEDGIVLARCIAEALTKTPSIGTITKQTEDADGVVVRRIQIGLNNFAKERKWRSIQLISRSYIVGYIQESEGKIMTLLRDKFLTAYLAGLFVKTSDFDCGKLKSNS